MEQKKEKTGYTIVTYRVRLYDRHFDWLQETNAWYGKVTAHFLEVLKQEPELLEQSDFLLLRTLEEMCIGTKEMKAAGKKPAYPLENFPKIPLYFRRSAINTAIDLARKHSKNLEETECTMTLYKGMYQNFLENSIELKLFHDGKWKWVKYPFTGRAFPDGEKRLSPELMIEKKAAWLHVPVSLTVADARTVKERMETEGKICAVYFPDRDVMAVAVLLDKTGQKLECHFFRGGNQRQHLQNQILLHIEGSQQSRGKRKTKQESSRWYRQLQQLNRHYAHLISRQILEYCLEKDVKVIVTPNYEIPLNFKDKQYLKTNEYHWIGRSIINKLKYKAFAEGVVVTSIHPAHIVSHCSRCGAEIKRYNEGHRAAKQYHGGKLFTCSCGNKGNTAENAAINIGKTFLSYY